MKVTTNEIASTLKSSVTVPGNLTTEAKLFPLSMSSLPDEPLVVIEPRKLSAALTFSEFWAHRELFYFLIWRDLKVRYKQTILGVAWVVLQPLLTTIIFTIFLGKLARVPSNGIPYPIFAYSGLLAWTFFAGAVINSSNSLVGNANLITKVYFPRILVPMSAIGARLVDFAIAFAILIGLMVYYGISITWGLLMVPVFVVILTLLALGIGMWTSALYVKYRDVGVALPVLIQLWMFVSPVIYPASLVPAKWQWLYSLNPLAGLVDGFRNSLLGQRINWSSFTVATIVMLALLGYSVYAFRRMEKIFADLI